MTTTYPDGGVVTVTDWAEASKIVRVDQRGVETTLLFDDLGRLYLREYAGTATPRSEDFSFDRSGRLSGARRSDATSPYEYEWTREYDKLGRPTGEVQSITAGGQEAEYSTGFGYAIDKGAHTTSWTMSIPRPSDPPGGPARRQIVHTLDKLNRLVSAAMQDGQGQTVAGSTWGHNLAGQRTTAARLNGVSSVFGYDGGGRLNAITHTALLNPVDLFNVQYGYDALGNRTHTRNLTDGQADRSERYGYDNLNRLTVMDRGVLSLDGVTIDQPLDHPVLNSNQQWADLDRRGNWLDYRWASVQGGQATTYQQTRTVNGVNEYDSIDPDGPDPQGGPPNAPAVPLAYDDAGNLTLNPLAPNVGASAPVGQWYDYDEENRVTAVYRTNGTPEHGDDTLLAEYEYDALGRRVSSVEYIDAATGGALATPKKTRHVYVGIETIEEYRITGNPGSETQTLLREFLWGDPGSFPEPLALVTQGGESGGQGGIGVPAGESVYHYLHDVLGSVVGLTDADRQLVERYTYDPYGRTLIERLTASGYEPTASSAFGNPWMWTGQRYDTAVALYAFLFRTYSPSLGRWLQRDPIGYLGGSMNLYEYVLGSPLDLIDPLGLDGCEKLPAPPGSEGDLLDKLKKEKGISIIDTWINGKHVTTIHLYDKNGKWIGKIICVNPAEGGGAGDLLYSSCLSQALNIAKAKNVEKSLNAAAKGATVAGMTIIVVGSALIPGPDDLLFGSSGRGQGCRSGRQRGQGRQEGGEGRGCRSGCRQGGEGGGEG